MPKKKPETDIEIEFVANQSYFCMLTVRMIVCILLYTVKPTVSILEIVSTSYPSTFQGPLQVAAARANNLVYQRQSPTLHVTLINQGLIFLKQVQVNGMEKK